MIYTITFNPSLDYIVHLQNFRQGETNRTSSEELYPGGKGINVSVVLSHLGFPNKALGFSAGFTGEAIWRMVQKEGGDIDVIPIEQGFSRINVKMKTESETEINGQGPRIPADAIESLFQKLQPLGSGDTLVLAGSIPDTLPDDIYQQILQRVADRGVCTVVDATGALLQNVLAYRPFLIKPNVHELGDLFGVSISTLAEIEDYSRRLQQQGAQNVLISMGADGAFLLDADGHTHQAAAPAGKLVNSVGSGDSMVAGFLAGHLNTGDYEKAFRLGLCSGSATAFLPWLADKQDICKLLDNPAAYHLE